MCSSLGKHMSAEKRLATLKQLLTHVRDRLQLTPGFLLWDGASVPADHPADALTLYLGDEGVIGALVRRPSIATLANLWAAGRVDIRNGDVFDLVAAKPAVRSREFRRTLDRGLALKTGAQFLFVPRGGPWPLEHLGKTAASDGNAAENQKNISFHYDVSNAFYQLWLDEAMVYTCAYYRDVRNSLDQAQSDKLEMTCRRLRLQAGETFLDIGCGWGALMAHAALHHGVIAHGVTLSEQQAELARARFRALGIEDRCTVELIDYSKLPGADRFDKISSLGMIEHVGISNYPTYFSTMHRLLKPGGLFLNHGIVRPGKSATKKKKRADFAALTSYIFPGGELDTLSGTLTAMERGGFEIRDVECWREHYMRTCRAWHDRLLANHEAAITEVGEVKYRVWLMYLAACAIAFERNNVGLYQTLGQKRLKGPSQLPPTREDLYQDWP